MKHFSSVVAFAALVSLGDIDSAAQSIDTPYQKAQDAYSARSYGEALLLFAQLAEEMPENGDVHYFYGRCALELKQYDDALSAFERALIFDPGHIRARLGLARLYDETGRYEHALLETDTLRETELSADARSSLSAFRTTLEKKRERYTFSGTVAVGGGYDSNANNEIGEKRYTLPSFPWFPLNGQKKSDDTFLYAMALLSNGIDIGERGGWSLQNAFTGYTKRHTEIEENDLNLFSFQAAPTWSQNRVRVEFPLAYERIYLHNDSYLHHLSATAKATYLVKRSSELSGGYTFRRGYYTDETLDVASHRIFASYKEAFGADPVLVSLSAGYIVNREIKTVRYDVENRIYQYGIQVAKTFPHYIAASLGYLGESSHYNDIDPLYGTRRHDNRHSLEAGIGYPLQKDLWMNGTVGYVDHRSNYAPYDYDKMTAMISLVYSF